MNADKDGFCLCISLRLCASGGEFSFLRQIQQDFLSQG